MGQAPDELKAVATDETADVWTDGLVSVLDALP
jgi:hypothetical protein